MALFDVSVDKITESRLRREFSKLCRKAGVHLPYRGGFHCVRRRVVTSLYEAKVGELALRTFVRWSLGRGLGVMPSYVKIPTEQLDHEVLAVHPFVAIWEQAAPYILMRNRLYRELRRRGTCMLQYEKYNSLLA